MFAYVASGRLVNTNAEQVSETKFQFQVPNIDAIRHLCVFMTGVAPLPPDLAAAVYLSYEPFEEWILLGMVHNDKPSAVFRLNHSRALSDSDGMIRNALLGISIEPGDEVVRQQQAIAMEESGGALVSTAVKVVERPSDAILGETCLRMLHHFYNYAMSFSDSEVIPVGVFQTWFNALKRKVERDPTYLYREKD